MYYNLYKGDVKMGFLDTILEVANMFIDNDRKFNVSCKTLEVFEIGTQWKGTARVHGAGEHVETISVSYETTITLPYEDNDSRYTRRGLLRKQLRDWAGNTFSNDNNITKENVVLNPSENCLSIEGFAKRVGNTWKLVDDSYNATNFCSYKLFLTDAQNGSKVGHEELKELFMAETLGRVTSVDVTEGF